MELHKAKTTEEILLLFHGMSTPCYKPATAYIVEPNWIEKEIDYDLEKACNHAEYKIPGTFFVIGGKLFTCANTPKAIEHLWHNAKASEEVYQIGLWGEMPYENRKQAIDLISSIKDKLERDILARLFFLQGNFRLAISMPKELRYIKVTEAIHVNGLKMCVNEWQKEDENGMANATSINVGDYLLLSNDGVICVDHNTFHTNYTTVAPK